MSMPVHGKTLLGRLARNEAGNALAIVAASIIPIIGMIGGGLDMSRIYLTRSRMQQACDASVLAGRRSMVGLTWDTSKNEVIAKQFFHTNFPDGKLGTQPTVLNYSAASDGAITLNASTVLPMTLMRIFNYETTAVAVTCKAELQLPNTDIMFVLDTTGSMTETNAGDSTSRITALRSAVQSFYQTLENARTSGSIIRYGFVPYSESVNVGMLLKRDWMVDDWTYQSRVPNGTDITPATSKTTTTDTTTTDSAATKVSGEYNGKTTSRLPLEDCEAPPSTKTSKTEKSGSERVSAYSSSTATGNTKTEQDYITTTNGSSFSVAISNGQCILTEDKWTNYVTKFTRTVTPEPKTTTTTTSEKKNYYFDYRPVSYDVRPLKGSLPSGLMAGGTISPPLKNDHTARTITWKGCIEERSTVKGNDFTDAYDMDIDLIPTADNRTKWRPALPELVFARTNMTSYKIENVIKTTQTYQNVADYWSGLYAVCPTAARKLEQLTASQISNYLSSLTTNGQTYHDIGLVWGARLLSPTGLFASENSIAANGGTIARHMIFMTDGPADTEINHYDAYGWPALDRRRSSGLPTKSQQNETVETRMSAICTATKAKGITLWVITFGTSMTPLLSNCASPGRAYEAKNTAELNARFAEIATQIAQLRVTD